MLDARQDRALVGTVRGKMFTKRAHTFEESVEASFVPRLHPVLTSFGQRRPKGAHERLEVAMLLIEGGEHINTRVETAIRIMSRWNKEGPVRTEKTGFLVVDYERLEELANEF